MKKRKAFNRNKLSQHGADAQGESDHTRRKNTKEEKQPVLGFDFDEVILEAPANLFRLVTVDVYLAFEVTVGPRVERMEGCVQQDPKHHQGPGQPDGSQEDQVKDTTINNRCSRVDEPQKRRQQEHSDNNGEDGDSNLLTNTN